MPHQKLLRPSLQPSLHLGELLIAHGSTRHPDLGLPFFAIEGGSCVVLTVGSCSWAALVSQLEGEVDGRAPLRDGLRKSVGKSLQKGQELQEDISGGPVRKRAGCTDLAPPG